MYNTPPSTLPAPNCCAHNQQLGCFIPQKTFNTSHPPPSARATVRVPGGHGRQSSVLFAPAVRVVEPSEQYSQSVGDDEPVVDVVMYSGWEAESSAKESRSLTGGAVVLLRICNMRFSMDPSVMLCFCVE